MNHFTRKTSAALTPCGITPHYQHQKHPSVCKHCTLCHPHQKEDDLEEACLWQFESPKYPCRKLSIIQKWAKTEVKRGSLYFFFNEPEYKQRCQRSQQWSEVIRVYSQFTAGPQRRSAEGGGKNDIIWRKEGDSFKDLCWSVVMYVKHHYRSNMSCLKTIRQESKSIRFCIRFCIYLFNYLFLLMCVSMLPQAVQRQWLE